MLIEAVFEFGPLTALRSPRSLARYSRLTALYSISLIADFAHSLRRLPDSPSPTIISLSIRIRSGPVEENEAGSSSIEHQPPGLGATTRHPKLTRITLLAKAFVDEGDRCK